MTKSRFSQLRNLAMTRDQITRSTKDANRDQITRSTKELNEDFMSNIPSEIIEALILRYIRDEDISMRDLERINILAYRGTGTMNDPSVGILQNLFSVLTEKILLPDYIDADDLVNVDNLERLYDEIAGIVDRTKTRALQTFGKNHDNNFFTAHLPSVDTIRTEFENFGQMEDRYIDLGGVFETIEISNHPTLGMYIHMPVRIASAYILPSGNKKKSKDPVIPQKQLNYVVKSVMHYFRAKTKDRKSKDKWYQMTVGRTHFQVTINPEGVMIQGNAFGKQEILSEILIKTAEGIDDSMSDQHILDRLQDVMKVIQEMANRIAEKSGFPHEHRHYVVGWDSFLQDEVEFLIEDPDAMEEDGDNYYANARASQQQDFAQFENLRVKMDEKISLGDVGGNPQAKEEAEKIIKSIKFSEIMKSWGAKPTSGIVFE